MAIISILAALLLPVLREARRAAQNVACVNQIHQINSTLADYLSEFNETMMWSKSGGNPSTCETIRDGDVNGIGCLFESGALQDPELLFCPDVKVVSIWGGGDKEQYRLNKKKSFASDMTHRNGTRQDYNIGWCGGAPKLTKFLQGGDNFGRLLGNNRAEFWIADGVGAFPYYYKKTSHENGKFMNCGRVDGSVYTINDYKQRQPQTGSYGYYFPYNDRPGWGWWRYFGGGLGIN